jgi:hypothetical protein
MKKSEMKFMPKFYDNYINLVEDDIDLIEGLKSTHRDFCSVKHLLELHQNYSYYPGKWTPKAILQHVIDNERIQTYRALAFSRNEVSELPGYNQNLYAKYSDASKRSIDSLLHEFVTVRDGSIALFESFTEEMLHREGSCSGIKITPLALGFLNIGHAKSHLNTLKKLYFKPNK